MQCPNIKLPNVSSEVSRRKGGFFQPVITVAVFLLLGRLHYNGTRRVYFSGLKKKKNEVYHKLFWLDNWGADAALLCVVVVGVDA